MKTLLTSLVVPQSFHYFVFFNPPYIMSHTLPVELQNPIKVLLFQDTPSSVIRHCHLFVLLSILSRYKEEFLFKATLPNGGRLLFVNVLAQQYIAKTF